MAAEQTWVRGSAFVIEDDRLERVEAEEDFTESGPLAGVPEPLQLTDMHLVALGSQVGGSKLRVRTQRAGYPGAKIAAGCVWRHDGDPNWRGWNPPNVHMGQEVVTWVDGLGALKYNRNPSSLALASGKVLVAYDFYDTTVTAEQYGVQVRIRDEVTDAWGNAVPVYSQEPQPGAGGVPTDFYPALMRLPNGRVMLYLFVYEAAGTLNRGQVRAYYSDDDGLTWAAGEQYCLELELDVTAASGFLPLRISAAYSNGQVLMVLHLRHVAGLADTNDVLAQYTSADLGNNFEHVVTQNGTIGSLLTETGGGGYPAVVSWGQGFGLVFIDAGSAGVLDSPYPRYVPLASSRTPFTEIVSEGDSFYIDTSAFYANIGAAAPQVFDAGECTAVITPQAEIYFWGLHFNGATSTLFEGVAFVSTTFGETWEQLGLGGGLAFEGRWWATGTATYPQGLSACWSGARCIMLSHHVSPVAIYDGSITAMTLGGWASVCMPGLERFNKLERRACYDASTYVPFDVPENMGWTAAGTGTGAITLAGELQINSSGNARSYNKTGGADAVNGCGFRGALVVSAGGLLTVPDIAVVIRAQDGATGYRVEIRFSATGYRVFDFNGGVQVGADQFGVSPTTGIEIMAWIADGNVMVAHRPKGTSPDADFFVGVQGSVAPSGTGVNEVTWGNPAISAAISIWDSVAWVDGSVTVATVPATGLQLAQGQANPEDLFPRDYAPIFSSGGYIADGVRVAVQDGPSIRADEWAIDARAEYGLDRALLNRSPRIAWRAQGLTDAVFAWRWSESAGINPSDVLAICIYGSNVPQWKVELEDNAGAYQLIGVADAYEGLEVAVTSPDPGTAAYPDGGGTDTPYLREGELQGSYLALTDSGAPTQGRRVTRQVAGKWDDAATRQAWVGIESAPLPTVTATGAAQFVTEAIVLLVPLNGLGLASERKGLRLTAIGPTVNADPRPPEDYYTVGRFFIGWAHPFAESPSWGRSITLEHGQDIQEQRDATFRTTTDGPPRRIARIGWVDSDCQLTVTGDASDPDYITAGENVDAAPISVVGGTLQGTGGLYRYNVGPGKDLVYIERFDKLADAAALVVLNRRHEHMLARIDSVHRVDAPQGQPGVDEEWRGQEVTLVETV